jgi:Tol biopolymer transport system component
MSLASGTRLGSYEIVAPLGAGGMGEVYRARDGKLNRDVAIKVLPEHLGVDPDALGRFEREAQSVASLSHPNILAIHAFGIADVPADGKVTRRAYAVTELLEGETLREKLASGALPARKAVEYALQIVHGIAAAHQKGIVHRDLKPENVFILHDGRVKILDFGLAKATGPAAAGSMLQTQSGAGTSPGTVMGTVGYMSPEQVRGLPVDHRTDIFSFGVVLYEMLSGVRAFRGESSVETMNAILKEDPPELAASGSQVTPALGRIVHRCLEKNPAERFHSAHDLGLALDTLSAAGTFIPSGAAMAAPPEKTRSAPWLLAAAVVAIAVAAYFAGRYSAGPTALEPASFQRLTFRRGEIHSARFAGDGKAVVYSATFGDEPRRLFSTHEGSHDSLALAYENADVASVSTTGELALVLNRRTIVAHARVGTLARASLTGGAARAVLEDVQDADWLPDGSGFAAARFVEGQYRLEFPVGKTVYETAGYISDVRVSPDGRRVAFIDHPIQGDDRGSIAVIDRAGEKRAIPGDYSSVQGLAWIRDGREIWFTGADRGSARALFATTPDGAPRVVARVPGSLHLADVGADGSVLLWEADSRSGVVGRARGDTADRDMSWLDWSTVPRISEDGKTLLITEEGDGGGPEYSVFMRSTAGGPAVRLGSGIGMDISPDGKWVLTVRLNPAPSQFILLPTGAGEPKELTRDEISHFRGRFVAGGTQIAFGGFLPGRPVRMYRQPVSGGAAEAITPEGVAGVASPDGTLVPFRGKLYSADGSPPRPIPGSEPGDRYEEWTADGRSLLVRQASPAGITRVFRLDLDTGRRTLLHEIKPATGTGLGPWFTITPDGSAYFYSYFGTEGDLFRVTGLK